MQADPIRAPARAQDLTLRHRVKGYRAGDLERHYPRLDVEEGFFINYGFLPRSAYRKMHPRTSSELKTVSAARMRAIVEFVRGRGAVHPRDIEATFGHGKTTNYWGRQSNATTHLLGIMHYHSMLRVERREDGIRVYSVYDLDQPTDAPADRRADVDALVDVVVRAYAPLPAASLSLLVSRLRYATPQWSAELKPALQRARERLAHARVDGLDWFWPARERPDRAADPGGVRLLSPFDPIVWDRRRFELLWGWRYRFEAYTPSPKRKLGHYALPLLWRDRVIGWCNAVPAGSRLECRLGFVAGRPRDRAFTASLEDELNRLAAFLERPRGTVVAA